MHVYVRKLIKNSLSTLFPGPVPVVLIALSVPRISAALSCNLFFILDGLVVSCAGKDQHVCNRRMYTGV